MGGGTSVHRLSFFVSFGRILREKADCKQSSLRQKLIKSIPWLRQKVIKSIPCLREKSRKTYPGWPHVPIKPLYGSTLPLGPLVREKVKRGAITENKDWMHNHNPGLYGNLISYPDLTLFYTVFPLAVGDLGTRLTEILPHLLRSFFIFLSPLSP